MFILENLELMVDVFVSVEMLFLFLEFCLFNLLRVCNEGILFFKSLGVFGWFFFNLLFFLIILVNFIGMLIGFFVRFGFGDFFGFIRMLLLMEIVFILLLGRDGIFLFGCFLLSLFSF